MVIEVSQKMRDRLWTFDELLAELPETTQPIELWDGELMMAPSPTPLHQEAVRRIALALSNHVSEKELGRVFFAPLDVILTPRRVVQPDVLFISKERSDIIQDQIRGAPDLVIEVVSPGTWRRDYLDKRALYEQFGIQEYWIVDPEAQMIEVLVLEQGKFVLLGRFEGDETAHSRLLIGFEVQVDEVIGLSGL